MAAESDMRFDRLMDRICGGLGFCGCMKDDRSLHVTRFIPPDGPVTADQFTDWVFLADNMNPNVTSPRWLKIKGDVRAAFVEHMGGEVADARLLRWSNAAMSAPNLEG